jgi:hypothetical protein
LGDQPPLPKQICYCLLTLTIGLNRVNSKPWRAAPIYRQIKLILWEWLSALIVAAGKPLSPKMT